MASFTFDDGSTVAVDTRIQNGVLALLQPLVYQEGDPETDRGPYLRTLLPIPQLPDLEFMEAQRPEFMRRMPGVLVYVGDAARVSDGFSGQRGMMRHEILIIVFSGVAGSVVDGRLDETTKVTTSNQQDPGVRVIRQHVFERLQAKHLPGVGVAGAVTVNNFMHLDTQPNWSSWGLMCEVDVDEIACAADTRSAVPVDAIRTQHAVQGQGIVAQQKEDLS